MCCSWSHLGVISCMPQNPTSGAHLGWAVSPYLMGTIGLTRLKGRVEALSIYNYKSHEVPWQCFISNIYRC